jgi:hypothetical protein
LGVTGVMKLCFSGSVGTSVLLGTVLYTIGTFVLIFGANINLGGSLSTVAVKNTLA